MLSERMLERYADVMIWGLNKARKKQYRKGEIVRIIFDLSAIRLAEILQRKLIGIGVHAILRSGPTPEMEKNFYGLSDKNQLTFMAPGDRELCEQLGRDTGLGLVARVEIVAKGPDDAVGRATEMRRTVLAQQPEQL